MAQGAAQAARAALESAAAAERRYRDALEALVEVPPGAGVHLDAAAGTLAVGAPEE